MLQDACLILGIVLDFDEQFRAKSMLLDVDKHAWHIPWKL